MIRKEKQEELQKRMELLGIKEEDLLEKFVLGSGKGGQKVNKTSSCVYLKHLPTQVEVKCQKDRSREMNRFFARRELCDQLEEKAGGVTKKQKEIEKIRKQKQRRARKSKVKTEEVSD
jgi:protein subunit release factor B